MSDSDRAQELVDAFEKAVDEFLLGVAFSDTGRQRAAVQALIHAAGDLEAISEGSPTALSPLLDHPNMQVGLLASLYQRGLLDPEDDVIGIRGLMPESPVAAGAAPTDETRVDFLVQAYLHAVLALQAAGEVHDDKAALHPALALSQILRVLGSIQPRRLFALAVLLEHENPAVRVWTANTLSAEMPERAAATLRAICATEPDSQAGKAAASVLRIFEQRAARR